MAASARGEGAPAPARWKKIKAARAADLAVPGDDDDTPLPEAAGDDPPEAVVLRLAGGGRFPDAVKVLAYALPKREAVWWACLAARHSQQTVGASAAAVACVEAAEAWVYKPVEERRQACYRIVESKRPDNPAALTALAAAWSGGSLVPPDAPDEVPAVPPDESLTARTVANAIIMAAVMHDPAQAPARFRRFLAQGRDIAEGGTGAIDAAAAPP
ncbi:DUF6931 family protein [Roseospira goensis]|uniref:Uncharacterized protein n=1 Tax=Roseospira goensis TaxID=391922 RepID=A0A7W6S030_9PROT|nr:hypothetical protein [Roseospira goensis]MBB4286252.1 hypothetical protein [Roseospira goensis]